jgi:hypothetical protein
MRACTYWKCCCWRCSSGYNIKPNIALIGGYRVLDVNYNKHNLNYEMNQRGPIMGLGFRF